MKTALIQASLIWENLQANRTYFSEKINAIQEKVDLIVLPEMFTTGFTMNPNEIAETMQGETISLLKTLAKSKNIAITGSLIIKENNKFYNRLVFVFPSGEIQQYDKRHLFTLAGEDKTYTKGSDKLIVDYLGWKICPLICYDLRFPVFARNTEDYDLLIYVANWPEPRINAWDALLKARAIENMSYVIGVNRIGEDQNKHNYPGHSQVLDCLGNYLIAPNEQEDVFITVLDKQKMLETRQKFGFLNDRDSFTI
ncbi:amidohydrolase [Flavobacterium sp.]|uniref:amidohydrolase n=1 Tax=Flavobacterium sp. TaxID=239 RepID=UPI002B4B5E6A|nr:amidohydrolase [Flavobacterium sp.]HLF50659.1 amidohydrolase [Flavobacterium sp.]